VVLATLNVTVTTDTRYKSTKLVDAQDESAYIQLTPVYLNTS